MQPKRHPRPSESTQTPSQADIESWLVELEPHLPRIANEIIRRRRWPIQPADVDDILQEVRIQLWCVDLKKYDADRGKLVPFVVTRIYWEAANHLRARQKEAQHHNNYLAQLEDEEPQATPEELLADVEHQQLLRDVVDWARERLPSPLERDAVLAPVEVKTLTEVASERSTAPWRVKRARKRGLERLRRLAPPSPEALARLVRGQE